MTKKFEVKETFYNHGKWGVFKYGTDYLIFSGSLEEVKTWLDLEAKGYIEINLK